MYLNMVHVKFVCANISGHLFMNEYICILKYSKKKIIKIFIPTFVHVKNFV